MTPEEIKELREAADAVGPRWPKGTSDVWRRPGWTRKEVHFMAAAHPQAALWLLDRVAELEAENAMLGRRWGEDLMKMAGERNKALDERDRLRARVREVEKDRDEWRSAAGSEAAWADELQAERGHLRGEVERLRTRLCDVLCDCGAAHAENEHADRCAWRRALDA